MALSLYTGSMYGTPVGGIAGFLDTNLVAAGWSIQASSGNLRRYAPGSSTAIYGKFVLHVDDSATGSVNFRGVRDGVPYDPSNLLPVAATTAEAYYCLGTITDALGMPKSGTQSAPPLPPFYMYADASTAIILDTAQIPPATVSWGFHYFGEYYSYTPGDVFKACVVGFASTSYTTSVSGWLVRGPAAANTSGFDGGILCAQHGYGTGLPYGTGNGCQFALGTGLRRANDNPGYNTTWGNTGTVDYIGGPFRFPNPVDNSMVLSPVHITQNTEVANRRGVRGRLRGLYVPEHGHVHWSPIDLDTFSGSGDLAGKTFVLHRLRSSSTMPGARSYIAIETSNTVESSP